MTIFMFRRSAIVSTHRVLDKPSRYQAKSLIGMHGFDAYQLEEGEQDTLRSA